MKNKTGLRIIIYSLIIALLASLPLILYIIFGPKDGNPIGLGLLAWAGVSIGQLGVFTGLAYIGFSHFYQKKA